MRQKFEKVNLIGNCEPSEQLHLSSLEISFDILDKEFILFIISSHFILLSFFTLFILLSSSKLSLLKSSNSVYKLLSEIKDDSPK